MRRWDGATPGRHGVTAEVMVCFEPVLECGSPPVQWQTAMAGLVSASHVWWSTSKNGTGQVLFQRRGRSQGCTASMHWDEAEACAGPQP